MEFSHSYAYFLFMYLNIIYLYFINMFKRSGIDMNFFKSLFKNNTPKPETQSFQASNLQTAISKILVRTAKIDDEFIFWKRKKY